MTLYLYNTGTNTPILTIEDVISYTADQAVTEDGTVYTPFAADAELSSREDCHEALRAKYRAEHPSAEQRMDELEALMAVLLNYPKMTDEERETVRAALKKETES